MAELRVEELCKAFPPATAALDEVTFTVASGECLALVGPSGCGKTTLLRVIAGLESLDSGEIRIAGQRVHDLPCHQREVAMLFQRPALVSQHTARQNMRAAWTLREPFSFVRRLLGLDRQREEQLERVARLLGLERCLDRRVATLSGGEQQRVALGRCFLKKAKLLLLDEPLGQLDAPLRTDLRREIQELSRACPVTTIHVTHDPAEALAIGARVAVMKNGRIIQIDTPTAVRRHPGNRFVAELLHADRGGLNVLAGHIRQEALETFFECALGRWPMPAQSVSDLQEALQGSTIRHADKEKTGVSMDIFPAPEGKLDIMIGIPADNVCCSSQPGQSDEDVCLRLPLLFEESGMAGEWVIAGDANGRWIGRRAPDERLERGQVVTMRFSMARAYWFDAATSRTLTVPTG